ncbi:Suppressor of fused-like [Lamellibrachia satsuma]|nr:Suppressor of fused-like [Lamellibrachia satsuma]
MILDGPGEKAIVERITEFYPDLKRQLQATVSPKIKYWQGGKDPLDHIYVLLNRGDPNQGIPDHWHFITFGFSDLHGDSRVHELTGRGQQSGYGFELTFRLRRQPGEETAPRWPVLLLSSLAKYVFHSGNILNCGDHIPWHRSLERNAQSHIQHMLLAKEAQLGSLETDHGNVQFRQIVGVTEAEMKAAHRWKGNGITNLLSQVAEAGGSLLVTDMSRQKSMFNLHPDLVKTVVESLEKEGCNLGNITASCGWSDPSGSSISDSDEERELKKVHLTFDLEAAELLPLVVKGRLQHGKYFVFQNVLDQVIVFVPPDFTADMVLVDSTHRLKAQRKVLQIYCSAYFIDDLSLELEDLENPQQIQPYLPKVFQLESPSVTITVSPNGSHVNSVT